MIAEVRDVFEEMLDAAKWLDYDTRNQAKIKVSNMSLKIGYPTYILEDELLDAQYEEVILHIKRIEMNI